MDRPERHAITHKQDRCCWTNPMLFDVALTGSVVCIVLLLLLSRVAARLHNISGARHLTGAGSGMPAGHISAKLLSFWHLGQ
jgi:hypothetical protein